MSTDLDAEAAVTEAEVGVNHRFFVLEGDRRAAEPQAEFTAVAELRINDPGGSRTLGQKHTEAAGDNDAGSRGSESGADRFLGFFQLVRVRNPDILDAAAPADSF